MKIFLIVLFTLIFVGMLIITTLTSLEVSLFDAWPSFAANPWAVATLWDAYFGFVTFYVWVAWREGNWTSRLLWLVLIMTTGNIAMSLYVLIQLFRLKPGQAVETILSTRNAQAQATHP